MAGVCRPGLPAPPRPAREGPLPPGQPMWLGRLAAHAACRRSDCCSGCLGWHAWLDWHACQRALHHKLTLACLAACLLYCSGRAWSSLQAGQGPGTSLWSCCPPSPLCVGTAACKRRCYIGRASTQAGRASAAARPRDGRRAAIRPCGCLGRAVGSGQGNPGQGRAGQARAGQPSGAAQRSARAHQSRRF